MPVSNLTEHRHTRSGSLSIQPQNDHSNGMMSPVSGTNRFDGARSPPSKLLTLLYLRARRIHARITPPYTSHVPCKFFRQGACQAGAACPFSHDIGTAAENICKYFAKGNCKFGPKCANIHVLPDGRRINYSKGSVTLGDRPIHLGARVNPNTYHYPSNSALTNSFLREGAVPPYTATNPYALPDERYGHQLGRQPSMDNGLPTIDTTTYTSNPTSAYGSPRDDETSRFGLGLSPVNAKGIAVMDAPLPASFDSNGISHAARYGPWPSSVPSKFGLESPSPSLNAAKDGRTSETLKLLHTSAFGSSELLSSSALGASELNGFGSSPPTGSAVQMSGLAGEEYFGKRTMHSSFRYAKPRLLSSSAPKIDRDWGPEFLFEEDYVPGTLANEVLTPAEKARRGSTTNTVRAMDGMDVFGDPAAASMPKYGSPVTAASPSRWGPYFQRQKEEDSLADTNPMSFTSGRSMKHAASAFGHVGSPLRNSSLASAITAELNGNSANGRPGPGGRSGSGSESLSALTQQIQRTRLTDDGSSSPHLHPNVARNSGASGLGSIGAGIIGKERDRERGLERHVSNGSIGSSVTGRFTTPIDEEDASFVFSMEEEDEAQSRARKRASGGHGGMASPLANNWTYAAAVANNRSTIGVPNGSTPRSGGSAVETTVGGREMKRGPSDLQANHDDMTA
ncbi:zinc finger protein LEE1 [Diplogelasinospora grovesii]|uniref:Zinc finger protein LEE1 n=1 Tax=Diplogelasinospora grovesii TaxID=303347 RepID=A0AAN6N2R9_9PEZI|nr:zinc finger protein LEE1 [Diplogelasinospora grovesii]